MAPTKAQPAYPTSQGTDVSPGEVFQALTDFFGLLHDGVQTAVRRFDLPAPYAMALAKIDGAISMKELGWMCRCDPSFVTAIADVLEQRGLVRREVDRADRRVKNLVLTRKGAALRSRLQTGFFDDLPGIRRLDDDERLRLITLLRKMVAAEANAAT